MNIRTFFRAVLVHLADPYGHRRAAERYAAEVEQLRAERDEWRAKLIEEVADVILDKPAAQSGGEQPMTQPYTDADVELVARILRIVGSHDHPRWEKAAENVLSALAAAGRLTPVDTEPDVWQYAMPDAAQREESRTEDCPRCRHWTPAQRRWHHCIGCDGTGQVAGQQEKSTRGDR